METMRVLEIFREPIANGGQESFIMNMYRNIDRDKVQMDFMTPFTCDNRELKKEIISMGGKVYHCDHPFGENNNKVFKECVGRFLKEHHYDTVHFHSGSTYALMEGSKLAAKAGVKNRIIHSHCCGFDNMKYRIIKLISVPALLKYPTEYFACSEIAAKWKFPGKIIRQKRYRVINNAVDTEKFRYDEQIRNEWRKKLGLENCFAVGHAGRFNIQKNHSFLLDIFKEIHDRRPDARLVLAGDGELKEDMIKKAESLGISDYVQFLGIRKDIPQLFNAMDVFVMPSFFEGLAVVGVEAQATGLPVYMSDCLSKELPVEELSNYIGLEKSAAYWAECILKGSQGFKRHDTADTIVKKKYEIKAAARQLQDYYLGLEKENMVRIYIACHKKSRLPEKTGYQPVQAGAEGKQDIGYLKDNTGDNISIKNPNFCELTALYWIWKNDRTSYYKGLVHYRRYFTTHCLKTSMESVLDEKQAQKILSEYDIILPKKEPLKQSAWEEYYMVCGLEKDLLRTEEIIKRDYPEYMDAWKKYFSGNQSHLYNMMICRSELFDEYCSWLFDILFKLEKQVDYNDYNDYQKRIFGFLSERLLNVWVMKKGLKVKELRTVNTDSKNSERLKIFLRRRKNNLVYLKTRGKGNACN